MTIDEVLLKSMTFPIISSFFSVYGLIFQTVHLSLVSVYSPVYSTSNIYCNANRRDIWK